MRKISTPLEEGLMITGVVILLVIAFPLIFLLLLTTRFLVVPAAALGGVALALSPTARSWFKTQAEQRFDYNGLRLATNVAVHPSHSWARRDSNAVVVGVDDFVQATLGPVEAIELPPVGCRVKQGDRGFISLRRGNRKLEVRAPVSGTVIRCNEALLQQPQLVNEEPFIGGWAVRLQSDNFRQERRRLLRGKHARSWFRGEVDRLIGTTLGEDSLMPALPDGGTLVKDLYLQIDDDAWKRLKETSFDLDEPHSA